MTGEWWGADDNCNFEKKVDQKSDYEAQRCRPFLNITENCTHSQSSTEQFWEKYVLNQSDSLTWESLTQYNTQLFICHLIAWTLVFLCIMKGIKTSGKVFYSCSCLR